MEAKNIPRFFFIALSILIPFGILTTWSDRRDSDAYFKDLNLVLTGIVTDKEIVTNDRGLLYIDVRSTSIPSYDPRAQGHYYCVIKNGRAEIIEVGLSEIQNGDSVVVNSKSRTFMCFRDKKLIHSVPLYLTQFGPITSRVKYLHRL